MGAGSFPKNRKNRIFAILWSNFLEKTKIGPEPKGRFSDFWGGKSEKNIGNLSMKFRRLYKSVGAMAAASVAVWLLSKHEPNRNAKRRSYYLKRSKYHPASTYWWKTYVLGEDFDDPTTNVFMENCFRRLFGVPRFIFLNLVEKAKVESWFGVLLKPLYGKRKCEVDWVIIKYLKYKYVRKLILRFLLLALLRIIINLNTAAVCFLLNHFM